MIEITTGTLDERIIKYLQKNYPVSIENIVKDLNISKSIATRVLQKFQTKGVVQLEPLPGKTFIRLIRNDFSFSGKKRQKKFIKHHSQKKKPISKDYDGPMYS